MRYVALGDSYTIGTSVSESERWPNQLVAALAATSPGLRFELVANLGVDGFTSRDVIDRELPRLADLAPGFVTLLVGVNDVVQGVPATTFEANAARIVDVVLGLVPPARVLVVTTPDYTVTPAGADFGDPAAQSAGIRRNNAILARLAETAGITVIDIHDISLEAAADRSLVARDGLHPTGAQYARWVERILPGVLHLLGS